MKNKIVVGLSGGVDSSVAAYLLKEQGYDVIGVTMQMWQPETEQNSVNDAIHDAQEVAKVLGIPHYVFDFQKEFKQQVMDYFVNEYLNGRTPNPCIVCNRKVKWEALLNRAKEYGAEYVATGHYARITRLPNGRYAICNSVTAKKDQTYALYNLTQEQLSHTIMPVGAYEKEEIRKIAKKLSLPVAEKQDSQDICFIPDGDYSAFLQREVPDQLPGEGNFINKEGMILGKHKGVTNYTIGQRKGLNLAMGHPVFVSELRPNTNEVVIGEDEDIRSNIVICDQINYMGMEDLIGKRRALVKIRYAHAGSMCELEKLEDGKMKCTFDAPVRAATPGQAAVFYEDGYVLGGGIIQ